MTESEKDKLIAEQQTIIQELLTVISFTPGNVYWKDTEGNYLGCNNNVADVLQLNAPKDIIGKNDVTLIGAEFAQKARKTDQEVLETRTEICLEEYGFNSAGLPATYLTRKKPLFTPQGKLRGLLGISFDITDRKIMEENLKIAKQKADIANQAKSRFLSTVSHELRTPLTSILGFANLLIDETISVNKKLDFTKNIINSSNYLLSLINNLLDYNKLESDQYELPLSSFNLKLMIEEIIEMLKVTADFKDIALHFTYENNAPEFVHSNYQAIKKILINLLGNAIKFTQRGFIHITVTCLHETPKNVELEIKVKDTGVGIPSSKKKHIFERFTQLSDIYTRDTSLLGTGLGLAIVKELTEAIGGKIRFDSKLNEGSTFYFTCTYSKALGDSPLDTKILKNDVKRILLVEDDPMIQIVHQHMLEKLGYEVTVKNSVSAALTESHILFDFIFVDLGLPDASGIDLIKESRRRPSPNQEIPIIVLTGYADKEDQVKCLSAGADEMMVKPISDSQLKNIISSYKK